MWSAEHALREEPNAAVLEHASAEAFRVYTDRAMPEDLNDEVIDALWCGATRSRDIAERLGHGEVEIRAALEQLLAAGSVVRHGEKAGDLHWKLVRPTG
jgi:hypothetical protein